MTDALSEPIDFELEIRKLNEATNKLHNLSIEMKRTVEALESVVDLNGKVKSGVGVEYEIAVEARMLEIVDDYELRDKRPPAVDIRQARARAYVREHKPELWLSYQQLMTHAKALKIEISNEKEVISGKQSVLNGLRAAGA